MATGVPRRTEYEKHGLSTSPEYVSWKHMRDRCLNPASNKYHEYGCSGVGICDRWTRSFVAFLSDVGRMDQSGMTIGRRGDCGNYEPGNAYWQTQAEQVGNRKRARRRNPKRSSRLVGNISSAGNVRGAARSAGISRSTIRKRLSLGWNFEKAISTPVDVRFSKAKT